MAHHLLSQLTIASFYEGLKLKKFSSQEITKEFLLAIKEKDTEIKSYINVYEDSALQEAREADRVCALEGEHSTLCGVPLALKDNLLIEGRTTTAASKILKNYHASYDATVVKKLKDARAVFLGKTNLDEFAMGSSTENSGFFTTHNPFNLECVPGGSSGGSAAAVAGGMALAALGSDTGGSIRQPAALCGLVGFKPTYGAVSRHGLIAMASSLDQIGPLTKTVRDARILFDVIRGKDSFDATSVDFSHNMQSSPRALTDLVIGVPREYFIDGISPAVREGVEKAIVRFKSLGFRFKEISLPHTEYALSVYYIVMPAEVSTNLARFDGIRYERARDNIKNLRDIYFETKGQGFGIEAKRRILLGTFVLSSGYYDAYYTKAQKVRRLIAQDFDEAFKEVDVILTPTTPTQAFKIGEKTHDPLAMYLADIFTISLNLAGLPGISIPVEPFLSATYSPSHMPIGFQLIGKRFHEDDLLSIGEMYEKEVN